MHTKEGNYGGVTPHLKSLVRHSREWAQRFKGQRAALLALLFLAITFMSISSTFLTSTQHQQPMTYEPVTKKRKKKPPRKHLYEICPHTVLDFDNPGTSFRSVVDKSGTTAEHLTMAIKGNMPVIISVPHGATSGKDSSYSWQKKHLAFRAGSKTELDRDSFQSRLSRVGSDTYTYELGQQIVKYVKKLTKGRSPYFVAARFHRRLVVQVF